MKLEFKNINDSHIADGRVFYLFGNYKKSFGVFCDFVLEKFMSKYKCSGENIDIFQGSVADSIKSINGQCDLFGSKITFFCIKNVEDSHLDKLSPFLGIERNVFILESGDYGKSKKITDYFQKSRFFAVASFKNDMTLFSLCKMLIPTVPQSIATEIIKIINDTDEDLRSLFKKISILVEANDDKLLKEYVTYKSTFFQQFDFIPMVRYLLNTAIKEKIHGRKQENIDLSKKGLTQFLLEAEISQKLGKNFEKSYLYGSLLQR
ncbi:hypothetical protein FACS189449_02560 [Alphaproteobacteria bacterium]|nr:hypothetical protein FACS189449_02560 [Alphaproteobacteria bacterium]